MRSSSSEDDSLKAIFDDPDKFTGATPFLFLLTCVIVFAFGLNAVAMASAVDLFQRRGNAPLVFLGVELELPRALAVVLGVDPEPFLEITATFPGASASVVEATVAQPIEAAVKIDTTLAPQARAAS